MAAIFGCIVQRYEGTEPLIYRLVHRGAPTCCLPLILKWLCCRFASEIRFVYAETHDTPVFGVPR